MNRTPLAEISETKLREEISVREKCRLAGVCDYCHKPSTEPPCKFPRRHHAASQTVFAAASTARLTRWLHDRPDVYTAVLQALHTPLDTCGGYEGPCEGKVLWPTPSSTAYEWDGKGEDPNAPISLCPLCSEGYMAMMQSQWADYYAGLL